MVGAGITGLAAAFELRRAGIDAVVLEAGDRPGGKVDSAAVGGMTVDSGPDGFLARDPAAADLCRRLGLGSELVAPASSSAYVWVGGGLRPFPDRSVLGAPFDAETVAGRGIVSAAGLEDLRRRLRWDGPALTGDASVGEVLRPRIGDEVFERLVDPLLGGINAGAADEMSIEASSPPLYEAARRGGAFGPALREVAAARSGEREAGTAGPLFQTVRGGTARIIHALTAVLDGAVHLSTPALSLTPRSRGTGRAPFWTVSTPRGSFDADGVILAAPAWETARLVEAHADEAAEILGGIEYADVALLMLVAGEVAGGVTPKMMGETAGETAAETADETAGEDGRDHARLPLDGSGFLVPRGEGLLMTACSWSSSKWSHYSRDGGCVLRVSAGRTDDRRWIDLEPADLVDALVGELVETGVLSECAAKGAVTDAAGGLATGTAAAGGLATGTVAGTVGRLATGTRTAAAGGLATTTAAGLALRLKPWRRSLPQYRPGHLDRVATVEACLAAEAPGVVATGAAFRGLGLPACVRQAEAAVSMLTGSVLC